MYASASSFRTGHDRSSRRRNQALRSGTQRSRRPPPGLFSEDNGARAHDSDNGGWSGAADRGDHDKDGLSDPNTGAAHLDFDPWANEQGDGRLPSDDITDFSSRMWSDNPDPVVSTVRTDIIRNRNGPAALWAAVREDDRVKTKSLMESGVDVTKGYIHELVSSSGDDSRSSASSPVKHNNLVKLRDRLRTELKDAQAMAEKLKGDAQRQFELGGFSQYNAADDKAKKASSRATDIETTLQDTEDLLREGASSSVMTITAGASHTLDIRVVSPLTVVVDDYVAFGGVPALIWKSDGSAAAAAAATDNKGFLVVHVDSSEQFRVLVPSFFSSARQNMPAVGVVMAESGTVTVIPSAAARRDIIAAAAAAEGDPAATTAPVDQAAQEGSWDVFGFLRNMFAVGGPNEVVGRGGGGGVPWDDNGAKDGSTTASASAAATASASGSVSATASGTAGGDASATATATASASADAGGSESASSTATATDDSSASASASGTASASGGDGSAAASSPDGGDGFAGDGDGQKDGDDTCCSCTPDKIDARWPGVKGSPIVNDMNKNEYNWGKTINNEGKKGLPDLKNPVGRKNQPKPCCKCEPEDLLGTQRLRFKQAARSHLQGQVVSGREQTKKISPVDMVEPRAVPRQSTVHQGTAYAVDGSASYQDGPTRDRKIGVLAKGRGMSWEQREALSPPLMPLVPGGRLEGSRIDVLNVNGDISPEHASALKSLFRERLKAMQVGAGKEPKDQDGHVIGKTELAHSSAGLLYASRSTWQHQAGQTQPPPDGTLPSTNNNSSVDGPAVAACKILGPLRCKEQLSEAVESKDVGVQMAISVLRKARAGSLCDQAGPWQCHESMSEARSRGHRGVVAAIAALKRGAGDYLRGVSVSRNNDAIRARRFVHDLILRSPNSTAAIQNATAEAVAAEQQSSRATLALRGIFKVTRPGGKEDTFKMPHSGIHRCGVLDHTATADCFCRMLGSRRCAETLFEAYMHRTPDAVYAIRALLGGDSPGPASIFCVALGSDYMDRDKMNIKLGCNCFNEERGYGRNRHYVEICQPMFGEGGVRIGEPVRWPLGPGLTACILPMILFFASLCARHVQLKSYMTTQAFADWAPWIRQTDFIFSGGKRRPAMLHLRLSSEARAKMAGGVQMQPFVVPARGRGEHGDCARIPSPLVRTPFQL